VLNYEDERGNKISSGAEVQECKIYFANSNKIILSFAGLP
jgi:hypothetical protein